ncbi:MAG: phosphotransferase family protein [SAR324 cluster bacterium]|nr:phosphotransferase family protein [SAR324 cluster bacterium]
MDREKEFTGIMPVRESSLFDVDALQDYMEKNIDNYSGNLEVRQFKGGQSNPTYLLSAGGVQYVMRRKPAGILLKSAHAVDREFRVLSALASTSVPVPKMICLCMDESVIGTWFYIMEYCKGRIFWEMSLPEILPLERGSIYDAMNDTIANLHQIDYISAGLEDFGKPENYVSRQIARWTKQYQASKNEEIPAMSHLIEWLPENIPEHEECSIVHGDFRMDNLVFHEKESRLIAVLDWEICTLGHPIADFSYHCMQWRLPSNVFYGIADLDLKALGIPTEEEYVAAYCRRTGRVEIKNWDFYMIYNMFRLAAILQGIIGRVRDGTAANSQAETVAPFIRPLAEKGWDEVQKL